MSKEIQLNILVQNPIDGTMYGLQKGKGPGYETVQAQLGNGQDLAFSFGMQVKEAKGTGPTLTGAFVQGPAGNRFVYLVIGSYAGQTGALWSGRMKVPLPEGSFQTESPDKHDSVWRCTVPGRTDDGKPLFATVKPFKGWSKSKPSDSADTKK